MFFGSAIFFLSLLTITAPSAAQAPASQAGVPSSPSSAAGKADTGSAANAQEGFVIEQSLVAETYQADGTGTIESTSRVRLQSDAGVQQFGLLTISYEKNFQTVDINYVRVRKPDGSVIATPLDDVQDMESEITRAAPFYSDLREKHVAVKGVAVGDVLEWQTVIHIFKALAPREFWTGYAFTKQAVVLDEEFTLDVPRSLAVKVKSTDVQPQVREAGDRRVYQWKRAQLKREEVDPKLKFGPPFKQPEPDVQISTFQSWDDVGRWYYSLQKDRVVPTPEIKAKALELTKDAKTDDEKMRLLYDFVATHFRYIGVAFGIGRYQPHSAADVLDNSYGDCKDKHTLLASLLQAVGIQASPAIISSAHAVDPDVPSPSQFDHVITAVHRSNDIIWLDTTSEVAPFGFLTANLRDKEALVIAQDGSAKLIRTPKNLPLDSFDNFHITGSLNASGELKASVEDEERGDGEVVLRSVFHRVSQAQWKDLVQQISYGMGFAGTVSDVNATIPEKTVEPFRFSYSYDRTDFSDWAGNKRITVPMAPMSLPGLNDEYEKSREPVRLGALTTADFRADIQLPAGYKPELPDNVDLKSGFAEYSAKYSLQNGTLHAERKMKILAEEVPESKYAAYREFVSKVGDDQGAWVTFTEQGKTTASAASSTSTSSAAWPWPPPPDTAAGREFRDGVEELRSQHPNEALEKLEAAAKLDPKLPGIWSAVGAARFMTKDMDGALEALRRQTTETPDQPAAWRGLAFTLLGMRRTEEALPVLQKWYQVAPNDRDAASNLGRALIALKKYKDALEPLQKAAELNPDSGLIQYQLGSAYLGENQLEDAYKHYQQSIQLALDPAAYENDAAYSLAVRHAHLDDIETWAKDAVQVREKDTLDVKDIDDLDSKHLRMMSELAAYWDTVGYIDYLRGDYKKAESYIRSSWELQQDSAVAEHLGDIYEKMQQPQKALRYYSLAANSPNPSSEVQDKLFRLSKDGVAEPPNWKPREELGRMRSIHLPQLTRKTASAEFMIMLTNRTDTPPPVEKPSQSPDGKTVTVRVRPIGSVGRAGKGTVKQIKFLSGSEELRSAEKLLRQKDLLTDFPDDSPTNIFRRGVLTCGRFQSGCEFTLFTADSVHSAN